MKKTALLLFFTLILAIAFIKVDANAQEFTQEPYSALTQKKIELFDEKGRVIDIIPEEEIIQVLYETVDKFSFENGEATEEVFQKYEEEEEILFIQWKDRRGFIRKDENTLKKFDRMGVFSLNLDSIDDLGNPIITEENLFIEILDISEGEVKFKTQDGYEATAPIKNVQGDFFYINREGQYAMVYKNYIPVFYTKIVTGTPGEDETPSGIFEVIEMLPGKLLRGPDYKVWVHRWIRFYKNYGAHDADDWRSVYGGDIYRWRGSHGCVNMSYEAACIIYDMCYLGMKVAII